jgi:MFS transporter, putative metabolite:H+ symporter
LGFSFLGFFWDLGFGIWVLGFDNVLMMSSHAIQFHRPVAFWGGTVAIVVGVMLHLPDFAGAADMQYHLAGMTMSLMMLTGMALVAIGFVLATWGLLPPRSVDARRRRGRIELRTIDDTRLTRAHWGLMLVLAIALVIDTMKPATLGFVLPGMSAEYGVPPSQGAWLLLWALTGTTLGSVFWGVMADRIGRRAAILLASLMFIGTAICGTMPLFGANLVMCFLMGIAAGGMLPIVYALMAESVPAGPRGWLVVLHGGLGTVGGTLAAAGCAALFEPTYSWRVLWLLNLPTGLLLLVLNRWIPESPRFLLEHGRTDEARTVLERYGVTVEHVATAEDERRDRMPETSLRILFRSPFIRQTLVVLFYGFAWGVVNWGFIAFLPTFLRRAGFGAGASSFLLFLSSVVAIPATVLVAYAYGRWSSRKSMVAFAVATVVATLGLAWISPNEGSNRVMIVGWLALLYAATGGVIAMLSPYTAEVFPTRFRGTGSGLSAGSSKLGGLIAGVGSVSGLLAVSGNIVRPAVLVSIPMCAAALLVLARGLETRGRPLEELAEREYSGRT